MPIFRKKPVEIEAVLFTGTVDTGFMGIHGAHFADNPNWITDNEIPYQEEHKPVPAGKWFVSSVDQITIGTLEGKHIGSKGDWIIKGIQGEIYPCKPDIFEKTYEEVIIDVR